MVAKAIVISTQQYLKKLSEQGIEISFAVILGSQVTGKTTELSDIDLIVVSPNFDKEILRSDIDKLWETAAFTDSRIEPIPCGKNQWDIDDDYNPMLDIAHREGQIVYLN